jgi:transcription elongation factor S-II
MLEASDTNALQESAADAPVRESGEVLVEAKSAEASAADAPAATAAVEMADTPAAAGLNGGAANGDSPKSSLSPVHGLKDTLQNPLSSEDELLEALAALKGMGDIPTKVLSETMIGKTVNLIAKQATADSVRDSARQLVDLWRQTHRKRKSMDSSQNLDSRTLSNISLGEGGPELSPTASQESLGFALSQDAKSVDLGAAPPQNDQAKKRPQDAPVASPPQDDPAKNRPQDISAKKSEKRIKVVKLLADALGQFETVEDKNDEADGTGAQQDQKDPAMLADEIEDALHTQLNPESKDEKKYMSQIRAVLYNLKDKKNPSFMFKIMIGKIKPNEVPTLSAEEMASDDKNAERAQQRKYAMEEIQSDWALKNGQQRICGMFTCGKCKGEKTTYFQMQTRSSDEPMTTFVTCLQCGNRWKFC